LVGACSEDPSGTSDASFGDVSGSPSTDGTTNPPDTGESSTSGTSVGEADATSTTTAATTSSGEASTTEDAPGTEGSAGDDTGSDDGTLDPLTPGSCGLDTPAFCETFEVSSPGGRGGDLDERVWSFARWAHMVQYMWLRVPAFTDENKLFPPTFCGAPLDGLLPPDDVRICDGVGVDGTTSKQLNEVFDDQGDFAFHSMRARQPFDFTDRTGTVVWDVDAKVNPYNSGHGWWIEVWITEDPAPMPYHEAPTVISLARRSVGIAFRFGGACESTDTAWGNAPETVVVTEDYEIRNWFDELGWDLPDRCFRSMDAQLNHFELKISQNDLELWATDFDDPENLRLRGKLTDLDLPFTRGYVHFQHAHYNASKDGMEGCEEGAPGTCPTSTQTFRWDNIGFDGPRLATPRGYDVENNDVVGPDDGIYTGVFIGWSFAEGPQTLTVPAVQLAGATSATLNFNVMFAAGQTFDYQLNDGDWHTFEVPNPPNAPDLVGTGLRGFSVPVALDELVEGDNRLTVRTQEQTGEWVEGIGNVDLTLEVAE